MSQTIHLQSIGSTRAKPAKEFVVGDFTVWNSGFTYEVVAVTPKGRTQITWQLRGKDGRLWDRAVKADRLVAFSDHHWR